jgi:putative transposase
MRLHEELEKELQYIKKNSKLDSDEKLLALNLAHGAWLQKYDNALDKIDSSSPIWLKDPVIAKIVTDRLHEFDGKHYHLGAYAIMPNHVHVLLDFSIQLDQITWEITDENYKQVYDVIQLIKGGSARWCNKQLNLTGQFWQHGCFDRFMRSERHRYYATNYIINNSVKAGLVKKWEDHPFSYLSDIDAAWIKSFLNCD